MSIYSFFANKITHYSGYLLDGSQIGVLARSRAHRYTKEELEVRAAMILFTAACGYLGAKCNNPEKTGVSDTSVVIVCSIVAFTFSHYLAMKQKLAKRQNLKDSISTTAEEIKIRFKSKESPEFADREEGLDRLIKAIESLSLSDDNDSRATQTLGRRNFLMQQLHGIFDQPDGIILETLDADVAATLDKFTSQIGKPALESDLPRL